jgi:hypothetical protein
MRTQGVPAVSVVVGIEPRLINLEVEAAAGQGLRLQRFKGFKYNALAGFLFPLQP